jgi:GDP-D-mannose dehydratase
METKTALIAGSTGQGGSYLAELVPQKGYQVHGVVRRSSTFKGGLQDLVHLGNPEARKDWGYAAEYVEAMWRMFQQDTPDDYVIATGTNHSVRNFVEEIFAHVGLDRRDHVHARLTADAEFSSQRSPNAGEQGSAPTPAAAGPAAR